MVEFKKPPYRWLFMRAVAQATPEVLESLRDNAWKRYESSVARKYGFSAWILLGVERPPLSLRRRADVERLEPAEQKQPTEESLSFEEALTVWVERFNLNINDRLFSWETIETLEWWSIDDSVREGLQWAMFPYGVHDGLNLQVREVLFKTYEGWYPEEQYWSEFEPLITKRFKEYLAAYRKKVTAALVDAGKRPVPVKRRRGTRPNGGSASPTLHFEWLALFQCRGLSFGEIADCYPLEFRGEPKGRDDSTVSKAIRETARLVGLKLRSERRTRK